MADQRSIKLIEEIMNSIDDISDYPSPESLIALIDDNEDILFISKCDVSWDWMIGRTEVDYINRQSIIILTRQRLMLVGGRKLPFQSVYPLTSIQGIYSWGLDVMIKCSRDLLNDPPNPPARKTGFKTYPKDARDEISYKVTMLGFDISPRSEFFDALTILPYSIRVGIDSYDEGIEPRLRDIKQLPLHSDLVNWNQLDISYPALKTIANWMLRGIAIPEISRLQNLLNENDGVFFISKYIAEYRSIPQDSEPPTKEDHWGVFPFFRRNNIPKVPDRRIRSTLFLTERGILLFSEEQPDDVVDLKFHEIASIIDVKENSNYEQIYGRPQYPKVEINSGRISILLNPLSEPDFLPLLIAVQALSLREKLVTHRSVPQSNKSWILKPFDSFILSEGRDRNKSYEDNPIEKSSIKSGYIYILINLQLPPNTLKIGKTRRTPEERASDIYTTGVPGEFMVAYEEHVVDCDAAEAAIHAKLASFRISDQREFFRLPLKDAVKVMYKVAMEIGTID